MDGSRRRWAGRLGLVIASSALALGAGELAVRALGIAPDRFAQPWHLERADKRLGLDAYPDDPRGYFPIDLRDAAERARWRERGLPVVDARAARTPHAVPLRYTEELCRGEAIGPRDPQTARVVVIGDSFSEGQGVREQDTFAARLDAALDAEVINCGRRGDDFPALRARFEARLALEPDVVLYAMVLNDPEQSEAFHERQRYLDDWILDRRRMVTEGDGAPRPAELHLLALARDRIEGLRVGAATTAWYRDMVGPPNRAGWEATLAHLEAMRDAMRARGGELYVVLWPLLVELDGDYPFEAVHATIRAALEARGVAFHDVLPAFRGQAPRSLWVHGADRHPNERAHARFAADVAPRLEAILARRGDRT